MRKRLKVDLKRSTMANWVIQTAETYLKPFSEAYRQELLRQPVIHADETVLQVNKEPGRDATAESRIWAYASSKRAERDRSDISGMRKAAKGPAPGENA